jgi:hypothetical protein
MNTVRARTVVGLGLWLLAASACSSDSKNEKADGSARRDAGGRADVSANRDVSSGQGCNINGTPYQPGESFVLNCARYTCQGDGNVTSNGVASCTDVVLPPADTRPGPDLQAPGPEVSRGEAGPAPDGARDAAPETGRRDALPIDGGVLDSGAPDEIERPDQSPPGPEAADTAPPTPDIAPPVTCSYGGRSYNPGDELPCDCNTCICTSSGGIKSLTSNLCGVDAQ